MLPTKHITPDKTYMQTRNWDLIRLNLEQRNRHYTLQVHYTHAWVLKSFRSLLTGDFWPTIECLTILKWRSSESLNSNIPFLHKFSRLSISQAKLHKIKQTIVIHNHFKFVNSFNFAVNYLNQYLCEYIFTKFINIIIFFLVNKNVSIG